jgi:KDO2-lipid IV(A) lauroyltransferase
VPGALAAVRRLVYKAFPVMTAAPALPPHSLDSVLAYQFGRWLCRWFPAWYCYLFARGVASLSTLVDRRLLAVKVEHYRHLFPDRAPHQWRQMARECYRCYSAGVVDMLMGADIAPRRIHEFISGHDGEEHFLAAQQAGRGVLLLSAHIGSWELGGTYLGQLGFPVAVVSKSERGSLERYRASYRQRGGAKTLIVGRDLLSLLPAVRHLEQGGTLVMMGDVLLGGPSVTVPFAGQVARFPSGWVHLAAASGATVLPCFLLPDREQARCGRYRIRIEPGYLVHRCQGGARDAASSDAVGRYAAMLERHVRAHPTHWFAFRPLFEPRTGSLAQEAAVAVRAAT